jgi:hypothetical protein
MSAMTSSSFVGFVPAVWNREYTGVRAMSQLDGGLLTALPVPHVDRGGVEGILQSVSTVSGKGITESCRDKTIGLLAGLGVCSGVKSDLDEYTGWIAYCTGERSDCGLSKTPCAYMDMALACCVCEGL